MSNPEISKMLTLSTAHVSEDSAQMLAFGDTRLPVMFAKRDYGWFIWCNGEGSEPPPDLAACIAKARALGCDWLCLDRDGETVGDLPTYEW
jgi:hypothetical protein